MHGKTERMRVTRAEDVGVKGAHDIFRAMPENLYPPKGTSKLLEKLAPLITARYYGCFVLISNEVKDPIKALELYRTRDVVEKAFGNLKERLNCRRTLVSSDRSLEGKLFVEFIALIYLSYIKSKM